jgi:hypothetical protein
LREALNCENRMVVGADIGDSLSDGIESRSAKFNRDLLQSEPAAKSRFPIWGQVGSMQQVLTARLKKSSIALKYSIEPSLRDGCTPLAPYHLPRLSVKWARIHGLLRLYKVSGRLIRAKF